MLSNLNLKDLSFSTSKTKSATLAYLPPIVTFTPLLKAFVLLVVSVGALLSSLCAPLFVVSPEFELCTVDPGVIMLMSTPFAVA